MKQPIEPNKDDCCNSGCNPCIFDVYERQLKLYEKYLENGETQQDFENYISQLEFTPFELIENVEIGGSYKLIKFKRLNGDSRKVWWRPGDHFLMKYNSDDMSCTRAYTPLKRRNVKEEYDFSIIVKITDNGLVSNYLNSLKQGNHTLWRGPYGTYKLANGKFDRIILIAQGTGIVAFIEIIEKILFNEDDMTRLILYYCCQSIDKILFREDLYTYRTYWNFTYNIFLSNCLETTNYKYQEPIFQHKLRQDEIINLKPFSANDQFLLCGSTNFMKEYEILLAKENVSLQHIRHF